VSCIFLKRKRPFLFLGEGEAGDGLAFEGFFQPFRETRFTAFRFNASSGLRYCWVVSMSLWPISFWTVTMSQPLSSNRVA
jgi:hypothetical protein